MRYGRGCGCLVLLLAAGNLLFAVASIIGIFTHVEAANPSVASSVLFGIAFLANVYVCVMFALPALRSRGRKTDAGAETESGDQTESEEDETEQGDKDES